jgi:hypothetical protein
MPLIIFSSVTRVALITDVFTQLEETIDLEIYNEYYFQNPNLNIFTITLVKPIPCYCPVITSVATVALVALWHEYNSYFFPLFISLCCLKSLFSFRLTYFIF